ncbi:hypothetical protein B0181_11600 [Moraxella caviae]|uniref:Phage head morphogenesis protein, SPP1 gp7 family n=1 Tax=Moraxella caviae TaxID=34060 RepID=A0A1S9ZSX8_9GAMM|nr:hypothetical protein [Moraxella caviae]OOR86636.1 hypothetical protein B0181_11600 [Moraxella caviae]STZ14517.1 phage head morphogenesis protein, SPP1 gp7 family [Moraxella caviae]VEW11303.1 phage head morphogenesis protein, SPP1 gp7 family [Moraxella caviae]
MDYSSFITRLQIYLESLKAHEAKEFMQAIGRIDKAVQEALMNDELTETSAKKLALILGALGDEIADELKTVTEAFYASSLLIADYAQKSEAKFLAQALNITPNLADFKSAKIANTPMNGFGGANVKAVLSAFADKEQQRIINAIKLARHQGKTNHQIKQIIIGTKAKRYQDGLTFTTKRHAKAVVHTTVQHLASEARADLAAQLGIDEIKVVATLDGRTSRVCRSLDGRILPISHKPPYHVNCRTSYILWNGKDPKFRASMNGKVENQTYYEWLATQDSAFQDSVLGKTQGQLFRNGGLTPAKFAQLQLDKNFRPLTLAQIKQLEPVAFDRAFK